VRAIYEQGDETAGEGRLLFSRLRFFHNLVMPADYQRLGGAHGGMAAQ
jgi:hypothetical protein